MSQVYNIPNTPIYSPLAGLSELYGMYLKDADQKEERAYKREQDGRTWDYKDREFDTNKAFKERELTDSARRTQSTIDYYNGELALKADPNSATNQIAMMTARANQKVADANALKANTEANKYNNEMKWTNSALGSLGGSGPYGVQPQPNSDLTHLNYLVGQFSNGWGAR
jgi:hypothetical protein